MAGAQKYKASNYSAFEICLVVLAVAAGLALRGAYLDFGPFWVDEAESSINALTILDKGYPSDTYLGLPIYENTLVQPWPESAEYEFRDISYSDRHMAIYHGWLPLYSIAASFALYHIRPDEPDNSFRVKHDLEDRKRRTRAARVPGILFGVAFLALVFMGGTTLYGRDAGWAGLLVATIHPWHWNLSRQARYYSAEITLTTACSLVLWLMFKSGKWMHFVLGGVAFVLLFHTHLLSFFTAFVVLLLVAPIIIRKHPSGVRKLATFVAIVAAGTLPWIFITGFYKQQGRIPRGWPLLHLPADLVTFPPAKTANLIIGLTFALLLSWLVLTKAQVPQRLKTPLLDSSSALILLVAWVACGYLSFLFFMPAASFYPGRLNIGYWGPGLLVGSVICAATARVIAPRRPVVVAPAIFLVLFFLTGNSVEFPFERSNANRTWSDDEQLYSQLKALKLDKDTRLYAAPPNHLILSFYTGLPFQSVAPIRKSYLNSYKGDVLFIDSAYSKHDESGQAPADIQKAALQRGQQLDLAAAERWSLLLRTWDYRETIQEMVAGDRASALEEIPAGSEGILAAERKHARAYFLASTRELMTRGFDLTSWTDWRAVVVYRFVDPNSRRGQRSNYAERLRGANALLLMRADKVIYRSRWHDVESGTAVKFEIVP
jgi:hypothetical protein